MQRRSFLASLGLAAIAAPLARFLPESAAAPVKRIITFPAVTSGQDAWAIVGTPPPVGMRGLPYIVNNSGNYFGLYRTGAAPVVHRNSIADQVWYDSLPRDRSLIPDDYQRGLVED